MAPRVKVCISAGLVELNKYVREATVRRPVVVALIKHFKDAGHPDYSGVSMTDVMVRVKELAVSDAPAVPIGLEDVMNKDAEGLAASGETDKAATPQERI